MNGPARARLQVLARWLRWIAAAGRETDRARPVRGGAEQSRRKDWRALIAGGFDPTALPRGATFPNGEGLKDGFYRPAIVVGPPSSRVPPSPIRTKPDQKNGCAVSAAS